MDQKSGKTRANTGHAVLQSTPKPPKMRRCNGPTDRLTDQPTDLLIEVLCGTGLARERVDEGILNKNNKKGIFKLLICTVTCNNSSPISFFYQKLSINIEQVWSRQMWDSSRSSAISFTLALCVRVRVCVSTREAKLTHALWIWSSWDITYVLNHLSTDCPLVHTRNRAHSHSALLFPLAASAVLTHSLACAHIHSWTHWTVEYFCPIFKVSLVTVSCSSCNFTQGLREDNLSQEK